MSNFSVFVWRSPLPFLPPQNGGKGPAVADLTQFAGNIFLKIKIQVMFLKNKKILKYFLNLLP